MTPHHLATLDRISRLAQMSATEDDPLLTVHCADTIQRLARGLLDELERDGDVADAVNGGATSHARDARHEETR